MPPQIPPYRSGAHWLGARTAGAKAQLTGICVPPRAGGREEVRGRASVLCREAQTPPPHSLGPQPLTPSPVLGELISEEVVSGQLDGLLRGDKGQVHSSSCGAQWGAQAGRRPGLGRLSASTGLPARRAPPQPLLGSSSCPLTRIGARRGRTRQGQGRASSRRPAHPPCMIYPFPPP